MEDLGVGIQEWSPLTQSSQATVSFYFSCDQEKSQLKFICLVRLTPTQLDTERRENTYTNDIPRGLHCLRCSRHHYHHYHCRRRHHYHHYHCRRCFNLLPINNKLIFMK